MLFCLFLLRQRNATSLIIDYVKQKWYSLDQRKKSAAEYANEAYKKAPNNPSIIDTFAWINTQLGKRSEAISLFRQALVLDFDNAEVKYHLAVTLKAEQRDREAYKLLTEAVKAEEEFSDKALAKELLKQWRLANKL